MEGNVDPKLFEAIGFFEKMLQTMPDDRTSLEFLAVAYEQAGEQDKQIKTLIKLSETLLKEGVLKLVEACGVGAFAAMAAVSTLFFALKPTPLGTGDVMTWTNEEILTEIVGILAQIDKEMRVARFKESLQDGTSVQQLQKIKPEQADKTAVVKPVNTLLQHP